MAGTSSVQSSLQADPISSSPPIVPEDSESAPLLSQDAAQDEHPASNADPEANASPEVSTTQVQNRPILILTFLSLALSSTSIVFITSVGITLTAVPFPIYVYWSIEEGIRIIVPIVRTYAPHQQVVDVKYQPR